MADIFISYAREDEDHVKELVDALEQRGCSVFWDRRVPPGQTWRSHIGDALNGAKCVIVAWSRHSVNSRWVTEEADEGLKRNALIPVLLDAVDPPLGFRSIQAANLTGLGRQQPSPQLNEFVDAVHHWLQNAPMQPHGETSRAASKIAPTRETATAVQPDQQKAELQRPSWTRNSTSTSPALWIGIAAIIIGAIVLAAILRNQEKPPVANARLPGEKPASTRLPEPASTRRERITKPAITVIFRDGSQKPLEEVVFRPGTKVCYRGDETRLAIERAGGIPFLLTDRESEEALRRGICEARAISR
jgi:TIR domain